MKLFTVKLTEAERAVLEVARQRLGLRSESDVIRAWIAEFEVVPSDHPSKPQWTEAEIAKMREKPNPVRELNRISPALSAPSAPYGSRLKKDKTK